MSINIATDYETLWPNIAAKTLPPGLKPNIGTLSDPTSWIFAVKRECVNRQLYYNGGCGNASSAGSTVQVSHVLAQGASAIPVVGGFIAGLTSIFSGIFAQHAIKVANEDQAQCQVRDLTGQTIPQIDAAVAAGQITAAQAIQAHKSVIQQCKQILAPVSGIGDSSHPCNAGCVQGYFLDALEYFAEVYYMDLSPLNASATAPGSYAPADNPSLEQSLLDGLFPPPGSPGTGTSFSLGTLLFAFVALIVVIFVAKKL